MKNGWKLPLSCAVPLALALALPLWTCAEKTGFQDPPSISIAEIMSKLATVRTQATAESLIGALLTKTGVGRPTKGSRYTDYMVSAALASRLAEEEMRFLENPDKGLTWHEVFGIEEAIHEEEWFGEVDFRRVVLRFRERADAALADPESPNNALVLAIIAHNGEIPQEARIPLETDRLSAVQDFLLTAWLTVEYGTDELEEHSEASGLLQIGCMALFDEFSIRDIDDVEGEKFKVEYFSKNHKQCLQEGQKIYKRQIKDCLRPKGNVGSSGDLGSCLEAARTFLVHDWIFDRCVGEMVKNPPPGDDLLFSGK